MKRLKFLLPLILGLVLFIPSKTSLASFSDVIQGSWYADHIHNLTDKGLIKGYQDGRFGTNDSIIRENGAKINDRMKFCLQNLILSESGRNEC